MQGFARAADNGSLAGSREAKRYGNPALFQDEVPTQRPAGSAWYPFRNQIRQSPRHQGHKPDEKHHAAHVEKQVRIGDLPGNVSLRGKRSGPLGQLRRKPGRLPVRYQKRK
jgi:hypothetical protein